MSAEALIKLLQDNGLEQDAIQKLLSDALASLQGPAEDTAAKDEAAEKAEAGKLLGVTL